MAQMKKCPWQPGIARPRGAKSWIIRQLLRALNSAVLNPTPCSYGFVGNVDAFSIEHLRSLVAERSDLTVAQLITEAEQIAALPLNPNGLTVIEDGVPREGTIWDVHDLRLAIANDLLRAEMSRPRENPPPHGTQESHSE